MSGIARDWLPSDAFTREAVGEVLGGGLAGWADAWFGDARVEVVGLSHGPAPQGASLEPSRSYARGEVAATLPGRGKRAVIESALRLTLGEHAVNARDHLLLDGFAEAAIGDLLDRLDKAVPAGPPGATGEPLCLTIALADQEVLTVAIVADRLVPPLKAAVAPQSPRRLAPARRWSALGATPVTLAATIGCASLSVEDIEGLAPGDVIVLDRALDDGVAHSVGGEPAPRAHARLDRDDAHVVLQF